MIEFDPLFQNILYFVGISNLEINEEETNKLQWKKARHFWKIDIYESLKKYDPFGPKAKVTSFAMINRLIPIFEQESLKKIGDYSLLLSKLLDFMILSKYYIEIKYYQLEKTIY